MAEAASIVKERRAEPRARTLLSGKIVYGVREEFSLDCALRNLSPHGGGLRLSAQTLPDHFRLLVFKTGEVHDARVAWRSRDDVGVRIEATHDIANSADQRLAHLRYLWIDATQR